MAARRRYIQQHIKTHFLFVLFREDFSYTLLSNGKRKACEIVLCAIYGVAQSFCVIVHDAMKVLNKIIAV